MRTVQGAEVSLTNANHIPVGVSVRVIFGLQYVPRRSGRRRVTGTIISCNYES